MSNTMKFWERIIKYKLRRNVTITENHFEFVPERSTTEAVYLLKQQIKRYRAGKKHMHMFFFFTDLEKAYDIVSREVFWWILVKKLVLLNNNIIKDIYESATTNVVACRSAFL